MSTNFNQLNRLSNHLKNIDCSKVNVPIGFSFSSDGGRVYLKYSLAQPDGFSSLDDALLKIKQYLDEAGCPSI